MFLDVWLNEWKKEGQIGEKQGIFVILLLTDVLSLSMLTHTILFYSEDHPYKAACSWNANSHLIH